MKAANHRPKPAEQPLKTVWEGKAGKALLRVVEGKSHFDGIAVQEGRIVARTKGAAIDETIAALRGVLARTDPEFFGFEGAIERFLGIYPQGFEAADYVKRERNPKLAARAKLEAGAPLAKAAAGAGLGEAVLRAFQATALLSPFDKARLAKTLATPEGDGFVHGAAAFAAGEIGPGLAAMEAALKPHEAAKWPTVTYLPFLWAPERHMFLKPEVTVSFARRIGHGFAFDYVAALDEAVYASLLDLTAVTEREIAALKPRDRIDVQSFIWVVGKYDPVKEQQRLARLAARDTADKEE